MNRRRAANMPSRTPRVYWPQSVPALLRDLTTGRGRRLQEAILIASGMLDVHHQLGLYERDAADPERLREDTYFREMETERPGFIEKWLRERPTDIRRWNEPIVPDALLDVRLDEPAAHTLLDALIQLLHHPQRRYASSAAFALSKYVPPDMPALPHLTTFLLRCTPERDGEARDAEDAWGAHQAAYSMKDMLPAIGQQDPAEPALLEKALAACRALAHAEAVAGTYRPPKVPTYVPDPREAARQTLFWTAVACRSRDEWRRLEERWRREMGSDDAARHAAMVWAVTGVQDSADGGVVIPGRFVDGTQPAFGKAVTVYRRDRSTARFTLRRFQFDVERWPPRVGLVLDAGSADELHSAEWITTSPRDQHEGEFSEAQLRHLEQMADSNEVSRDKSLDVPSNPTGTARDQ